jgi:hypothetical protein
MTCLIPRFLVDTLHSWQHAGENTLSQGKSYQIGLVKPGVAACVDMTVAAVALSAFYLRAEALSFSAINANRLLALGTAIAQLVTSPASLFNTAAILLIKAGSSQARELYGQLSGVTLKKLAELATDLRTSDSIVTVLGNNPHLKSLAQCVSCLAAGFFLLSNTETLRKIEDTIFGKTHPIHNVVHSIASKLVWKKGEGPTKTSIFSRLIPTVIRDLCNVKYIGSAPQGAQAQRKEKVAAAVDACEQIVATAAIAYGFHRLAGGFSAAAVDAHRLYSGIFFVTALILSPTTTQIAAGALGVKDGASMVFQLYHNVAYRSLKSYVLTTIPTLLGWASLCSSASINGDSRKADAGQPNVADTYLFRPLAKYIAGKLVTPEPV